MTKRTLINEDKKRKEREENEIKENERKEQKKQRKLTSSSSSSSSVNPPPPSSSSSIITIKSSQSYPILTSTKKKLPSVINYHNFQSVLLPNNWGESIHATKAAQNNESYAILMGNIDLEFKEINNELLNELIKIVPTIQQYRDNFYCNSDGEYPSPNGQIPLSRVYDYVQSKELKPLSSLTKELLNNLWALQSPHTSPWNIPFIRVYSTYTLTKSCFTISYHLYFSRLIFELISDSTIKFIVENLKNQPCKIVRCKNPYKSKQTHDFTKPDDEMLQVPEFRFSLQGLLKKVENLGYDYSRYSQPDNLLVNLFDYQKSTCQWMLDHELDETGLNGQFWEEWQFPNNDNSNSSNDTSRYLYYFPLGGEFRFTKPPMARGGLLCEEMGLGKTVEILALILGNPSTLRPKEFPKLEVFPPTSSTTSSTTSSSSLSTSISKLLESNGNSIHEPIPCHTTLIIVPPHLIPQWWDEIKNRTKFGINWNNGEISAISLYQRNKRDTEFIPVADIRSLTIIIDPDTNEEIYLREEWGNFEKTRGHLVEIRNVPFTTPGIILRGIIATNNISPCLKARIDDSSTNPTLYPSVEIQYEMNCENFYSINSDLNKFDIVLTSYSEIRESRGNQNIYMSHKWHRIILDECQEIKIATNQVATLCSTLQSERRWMVSGTPLCTKIEDLHGELNFLKIWPFCLDNSKDGFWELRIGKPFRKMDESSLTLLYALIDVVMMRHTKNQRYLLTNQPLIKMPSRTIEWKGIELDDDDRYVYEYIESFAADAYEQFIERQNGIDFHRTWNKSQFSGQIKSLYSLLTRCCTHTSTISLQNLDHLKRILVRNTYHNFYGFNDNNNNGNGNGNKKDPNEITIPLLTPEEVLNRVQSYGSGAGGGLNRESNRVQASVTAHEAEQKIRDILMERSIQSLNDEVVELGLPQPISWNTLPYTASIQQNSKVITIYPLLKDKKSTSTTTNSTTTNSKNNKNNKNNKMTTNDNEVIDDNKKQSTALHTHFFRGDIGRIHWADKDDTEFIVSKVIDKKSNPHDILQTLKNSNNENNNSNNENNNNNNNNNINNNTESLIETTKEKSKRKSKKVQEEEKLQESGELKVIDPINEILGEVEIENSWTLDMQVRVPIFKKDIAKRKQPFVDLLIARAQSLKTGDSKGQGIVQIHEGGFSTIYKLMAGQSVPCPLCLVDAYRPTVTTCVHAYCHDCIIDVVKRETSNAVPYYGGGVREAKCPVCRRGINYSSLMEVKINNVEDIPEEKVELERLNSKLSVISENDEHLHDQVENNEINNNNQNNNNDKNQKDLKKLKNTIEIDIDDDDDDMDIVEVNNQKKKKKNSKKKKVDDIEIEEVEVIEKNKDENDIQHINKDITLLLPIFNEDTIATYSTELEKKFHKDTNNSSYMYRDPRYPSITPSVLPLLNRTARSHISGKIKYLITDIKKNLQINPFQKFIIYSQYKESIVATKSILESQNIQSVEILTSTSMNNQNALKLFYYNSDINVLFLSTNTSSTGLTLTIASTVYILEPSSSIINEIQAMNRIYRIGQTKCIRVVVLYAIKTCEERLLKLRKKHKILYELLVNERICNELSEETEKTLEGESNQQKPIYSRRRKSNLTNGLSSSTTTTTTTTTPKGKDNKQDSKLNDGMFFVGENLGYLYGTNNERREINKVLSTIQSTSTSSTSSTSSSSSSSSSSSRSFGFLAAPAYPSFNSSNTLQNRSNVPSSSTSSSFWNNPSCSSTSNSTTTNTNSTSNTSNSSNSLLNNPSLLFPHTGGVASVAYSAISYGTSAVASLITRTLSGSTPTDTNNNTTTSSSTTSSSPVIVLDESGDEN